MRQNSINQAKGMYFRSPCSFTLRTSCREMIGDTQLLLLDSKFVEINSIGPLVTVITTDTRGQGWSGAGIVLAPADFVAAFAFVAVPLIAPCACVMCCCQPFILEISQQGSKSAFLRAHLSGWSRL